MANVAIVGVGQTPVGEHWDLSLRHLALQAMQTALESAGLEEVDAVVVGNALAGVISNQRFRVISADGWKEVLLMLFEYLFSGHDES